MRLFGALTFVLAIHYATAERFWYCAVDDDPHDRYCQSVSTVRKQKHSQYTKHWNIGYGQTTTGSTVKGESTGPKDREGMERTNAYFYFESTPSVYDDPKYHGTLTFKKIPLLGRTTFVISGRYHAYGADSDMLDLDVMVSTGQHMDLKMKSKDQYTWNEFELVVTVDDGVEYIDLMFKAKACGFLADYAIDDIALDDLKQTACDAKPCSNNQYCLLGDTIEDFTCPSKCTDECGMKVDVTCHEIKNRVSVCSCRDDDSVQCGYENTVEIPSCLSYIYGCSFEYEQHEECVLSPDFFHRQANPQLAIAPYWPAEKYGYKYTVGKVASPSTIELRNLPVEAWDGNYKVTFFYLINKYVSQVKEISVKIELEGGEVMTKKITINRMLYDQWVYAEVLIPHVITPTDDNKIHISIEFYGQQAEVNIDSLFVIHKEKSQILTTFSKSSAEKVCIISETDAGFSNGNNGLRSIAFIHKVAFTESHCSCPPTYVPEEQMAIIVCHPGTPEISQHTACIFDENNPTAQCTGHNVKCSSDNLCVCIDGHRSDFWSANPSENHPGSTHHTCIPYQCISDPCKGNTICIDAIGVNAYDHKCLCADKTEVADAEFCDTTEGTDKFTCEHQDSAGICHVASSTYEGQLPDFSQGQLDYFKHDTDTTVFTLETDNIIDNPDTEPVIDITLTSSADADLVCRFEYMHTGTNAPTLRVAYQNEAGDGLIVNELENHFATYVEEIIQLPSYLVNQASKFQIIGRIIDTSDRNGQVTVQGIRCYRKVPDLCETANPCADNAHCTIDSFDFETVHCVCPYGFSGDGLSVGGTGCTADDQTQTCHNCAGQYMKCTGNICECGDGFVHPGTCQPNHMCHDGLNCGNGLCINDKTCLCPPGYEMHVTLGCRMRVQANCDMDCEDTLDGKGVCNICNLQCMCMPGYSMVYLDNGETRCDRNGKVRLGYGRCSKSCGTGTKVEMNVCYMTPTGAGLPCVIHPIEDPQAEPCNTDVCDALTAKCTVSKSCEFCDGAPEFLQNEVPGYDELKIDHEYLLSKLFALLTKYNKRGVSMMCQEAMCQDNQLCLITHSLRTTIEEIESWETKIQEAMAYMERLLDCHSSYGNDIGHNERFWKIYEKLCELYAYLPHAKADLTMKIKLVVAEQENCRERTHLHKLLNSW